MYDGESLRTYGDFPPDAVISLLGNDVRAAILWTLSQARGSRGPPPILSFSELRAHIDVEVESSRFNYHLQQLVGTYIERVEPETNTDAQPVSAMADVDKTGFRLRPEGTALIRTLRAWSTDYVQEQDCFEVETDCYHCGTPLTAWYRNAIFTIQRPTCKYVYDYNFVPPGVLTPNRKDLLDQVAAYNRVQRFAFAQGTCSLCGHSLDIEMQEPAKTGYPRDDLRKVIIRRGCAHCGNKDTLTLGEAILAEPSVISFAYRQGVDLLNARLWEVEFAATDRYVTVESIDPWAVSLAVPFDDEILHLRTDESLTVIKHNQNS